MDVQAARDSIKVDVISSVDTADDSSDEEEEDDDPTTRGTPRSGSYAVVQCGEKFSIGMVLQVGNHSYHIQYMKRTGSHFEFLEGQNSWQTSDDIKAILTAPNMDRRGHYFFTKKDMSRIGNYIH
ncbi:hypothetical protein GJAV_G00184090 [Gymnothorax javanicus]|nr:hypothetical protein GJAV_G00184090 [Gymnothorax javanicus]